MLMLTALRLNEAARAELSEFDPAFARLFKTVDADALKALPDDKKVWIIPAERMKGRNEEARPHAVPLTDEMIDILAALPRYKGSKFLFTTTFGNRPVSIGSKVKNEIDARMLRTLRALARQRGDDPGVVELPPWVNHDIRRTIRSALSALKVAEEVREAVIAHARPGIKGTYDLYGYLDEKREALNLWAARLRSIVNPPADNVVPLRAERQ
jgi:integrase